MQNKFLETWWASLGLRPVGGPRDRMGSTFFGLVDMGLLGLPMGPLGLPSLISHFTLFMLEFNEEEDNVVARFSLSMTDFGFSSFFENF